MNAAFNFDHDEARALHRIVRAMHDGECPNCHTVHPADLMRSEYVRRRTNKALSKREAKQEPPCGWQCPSCLFAIDASEAADVLKIFAPFMERNLEIFENWRHTRG